MFTWNSNLTRYLLLYPAAPLRTQHLARTGGWGFAEPFLKTSEGQPRPQRDTAVSVEEAAQEMWTGEAVGGKQFLRRHLELVYPSIKVWGDLNSIAHPRQTEGVSASIELGRSTGALAPWVTAAMPRPPGEASPRGASSQGEDQPHRPRHRIHRSFGGKKKK